jgi:type III restriction enzyme
VIVSVDLERIEEVSARMDLRPPNRRALESLVGATDIYYSDAEATAPFECVIDSATGVGKTYVMAAAMEYLAATNSCRNFAVIAPGRTIRDKTIANFTAGHRRSLLPVMQSKPMIITAENFKSPAVRAAIDDDAVVKLYVFTVQALLKPTTKAGRKTHDFQEGLGAGLYEHLAALEDLVVFADEHHCYYGDEFSGAVRGLQPYVIVGLTATPHAKTPPEEIVYRYPLAAAIADKWVKTPVIVGRHDDRQDAETKLGDGLTLLDFKQQALDAYCSEQHLDPVRAVMLVVAQSTADADEFAAILGSEQFDHGRWAETILVVHSTLTGDKKEAALAALEAVEEPDSPVRIIISVGMLKEGWDVKNVYVIASMRASVSNVLTEQTLGRGLRLPFERYTGVELLDTVEVVAHERYSDLLAKANVLNEAFIDQYTWLELRQNQSGQVTAEPVAGTTETPVMPNGGTATDGETEGATPAAPGIASFEERTGQAAKASSDYTLTQYFDPKTVISVPVVRTVKVEAHFSLHLITDFDPYRKLGKKLAADPSREFHRTKVEARIVTGLDGLSRTELVATPATDSIAIQETLLPLETLVSGLVSALIASPVVPQRADQAKEARPIIDAFLDGLRPDPQRLLSAYFGRAAARLVALVTDEHRRVTAHPQSVEKVELRKLDKQRVVTRRVELNRQGKFARNLAYDSWAKSVYEADWFDSEPERAVAIMADEANSVSHWIRLQTGDVPIVWRSDGREYNPDLIVVETDGTHWLVEAKMDKEMSSEEVLAKRKAALVWTNIVNASEAVEDKWGYVLVSETDIEQARGSWVALKQLDTA